MHGRRDSQPEVVLGECRLWFGERYFAPTATRFVLNMGTKILVTTEGIPFLGLPGTP